MKIVISQPRYLPAINYINRLSKVDIFIILDTVQRQSRGWENRNQLLVQRKPQWFTIPINSSSRAIIYDTVVKTGEWVENHKRTIINNYKKYPYFEKDYIENYYSKIINTLHQDNYKFSDIIINSFDFFKENFRCNFNVIKASSLDENRENWLKGPEELLRIAKLIKADVYISGPNGKNYGVEQVFYNSGISIKYHNFIHPEYTQPGLLGFIPFLGFFDVLFSLGQKKLEQIINTDLNLE